MIGQFFYASIYIIYYSEYTLVILYIGSDCVKKVISALIVCFILICVTGCNNIKSENMMEGVKETGVSNKNINLMDDTKESLYNFSTQLFKKSYSSKGNNTLVSPVSVASALGMTLCGADGDTKKQMEEMFGADSQKVNEFLKAYRESLPFSEDYKVGIANSLWIRDKYADNINKEFLSQNKDYYDSQVYKAGFDDKTKDDINRWVNKYTNKTIDKIIDGKINKDTCMYLINALTFDAKWWETYEDKNIHKGKFTDINNKKQNVEFMNSTEFGYIKLDNAEGFCKNYKEDKYSFVAILPDKNVSLDEFIDSFDMSKVAQQIKADDFKTRVDTYIPEFETEYSLTLNKVLKDMGMKDAFGMKADFSKMSSDELYVSDVLHKTFIKVDAKGTKAGAVTKVEMEEKSADSRDGDITIRLDRPFVYMIIDIENNVPLFIGTLTTVK